jgi:lipoyl(octanoyl) transferase
MERAFTSGTSPDDGDLVLRAYLLGAIEWEAGLSLQRRLVYEIGAERNTAALVLCEHPPLITIGRHGSRSHVLYGPEELAARRLQLRWVNRGGGCLLHAPGQLAIYFMLPLDRFQMGVRTYLDTLQQALAETLNSFHLGRRPVPGRNGVWVGDRPIAAVGVAIRDWITYHGAFLNINPDLEAFKPVRWGSLASAPMTSLERERRGPLRSSLVRERLLECFSKCLGFDRTSLFTEHPSLRRKAVTNVFAASP